MIAIDIDLYSDTQSKPTPDMRKAMAEAEVGDEQHGTDPTPPFPTPQSAHAHNHRTDGYTSVHRTLLAPDTLLSHRPVCSRMGAAAYFIQRHMPSGSLT